ncbi:uncharacterized protein [Nicotiana sylvestris]|uniref:uncharacterized protein n=1 Tax=Nicotiana sylvestris TaxID=4096 RepID=UPI00388C5370
MVTFSDDELPVEGTEHNKVLYLKVKYEDSVVTWVLVDNGSTTNICPLSTLNTLKVDDERIHKNSICDRGFDGGEKDSVGDIVLELTIGPVEFTMEFQVLDVAISYNLLLGRLWIHAAKAVPSTLHQIVKFEWDRYEIIVHSEENLWAHGDAPVPFIEAEDDKGPWVYQVFETVPVEKVPEGKCIPTPKITSASIMVAYEMLKNGVVRGKGLGASLQGIIQPVSLHEKLGTFDLGFKPTPADPSLKSQSNSEIIIQEIECDDESEHDKDETFEEISKELNHFEEKPKPNLNETEAINLRDPDNVSETKISVHLEPQIRKEIIKALFEYKDIFAWSYDDMPGLSTDLVVHKLPVDPAFPPVKQKVRKFKTDISVKIKEEVTKQLDTNVIRVTRYPTWLSNVVPVPKKDGKTRVCVDYRDLNKASPKDNFPLPNIHILINNCAKQEIGYFVDCYAGYHKILMDEEDAEITTFITLWGTYYYRVMPFSLKNVGAIYMREMTTIFHDIIHKEIEFYVNDVIIKFRKQFDHNDITGRKEQAIYYLSKKFISYEVKYTPLERTCCALTWVAQKLKHYVSSYTTYLISRLDPLKYIFQKPMPTGRLAKWQILLTEFDIIYVTQAAMKAQDLTDHLAENPVDEEYEPLKIYFPDEEVTHIDEVEKDEKLGWKLFFDGAANMKSVRIGAVLISEIGHHYPITAQLCFYCTNNMAKYEACILGLRLAMDMRVQEVLVLGDSDLLVHQIQGE